MRDRFREINFNLEVLDLNQGDFTNLTLTRQIEQTIKVINNSTTPITLIGSSFGGLTAAWVAQQQHEVTNLVLLAPAFGFPQSWYSRLSSEQIEQWRNSGYLGIYHYGMGRQIPLSYQFLEDADRYSLSGLKRSLPTMIIHGINDDVVPIEVSQNYAKQHSQVRLVELDSDHGLNNAQEKIWRLIKDFLNLA